MAVLTEQQLAALPPTTRMLEIGCGPKRIWPGSTAIDVNPRSKADVIHDLNITPWPFADNTFDIVVAEHVIEHLRDIIAIVEEVHRILKPGGLYMFHYAKADFKKRSVVLKGAGKSFLHRWLYKKANRNPTRYESQLTWIFPLETVNFELEAIK